MDEKVRVFCAIFFKSERDLTIALAALERKMGRYDFFSKSIKIDAAGDNSCRLVSFAKVPKYGKIERSMSNLREIESELKEEQNASIDFLCGFLNSDQV